jgi:hypothetical protein
MGIKVKPLLKNIIIYSKYKFAMNFIRLAYYINAIKLIDITLIKFKSIFQIKFIIEVVSEPFIYFISANSHLYLLGWINPAAS